MEVAPKEANFAAVEKLIDQFDVLKDLTAISIAFILFEFFL